MDKDSEWKGGKSAGCISRHNRGAGGWFVMIQTSGQDAARKLFSDSVYGGADKSRAAAEAWRAQVSLERGLTKNRYRCNGEWIEVQLPGDKVMIVDRDDLAAVEKYVWSVGCGGTESSRLEYAQNSFVGRFHNFITGCKFVDHINRNTLDNRKSNLRPADHAVNAKNRTKSRNNTSGVSGVCRNPDGRWIARWFECGKRRSRSFSVAEFGEEEAKRRAIENRQEKCIELGINNE